MAQAPGGKRVRGPLVVIVAIVAAVVVVAIKGNSTKSPSVAGAGTTTAPATTTAAATTAPATTTAAATTAPATTTAAPTQTGHIGSTFNFQSGVLNYFDSNDNDVPYKVQLTSLLDPAQGVNQFNQPSHGDRFVAAVFLITDLGNVPTDDAGADVSVVGSNKRVYSGGDSTVVSECTNLYSQADYEGIPVNLGSATGCAVFQLPVGVKVSKVEWSATQGNGEWIV